MGFTGKVVLAIVLSVAAIAVWRSVGSDSHGDELESAAGRTVASDVGSAIQIQDTLDALSACVGISELRDSATFALGSDSERKAIGKRAVEQNIGVRWTFGKDAAREARRDADRLDPVCDAATAGAWTKARERLEDVLAPD